MAVPTNQDRFSFGSGDVSWQARGAYGDVTRVVLVPVVSVACDAELGAHDAILSRDARRVA